MTLSEYHSKETFLLYFFDTFPCLLVVVMRSSLVSVFVQGITLIFGNCSHVISYNGEWHTYLLSILRDRLFYKEWSFSLYKYTTSPRLPLSLSPHNLNSLPTRHKDVPSLLSGRNCYAGFFHIFHTPPFSRKRAKLWQIIEHIHTIGFLISFFQIIVCAIKPVIPIMGCT